MLLSRSAPFNAPGVLAVRGYLRGNVRSRNFVNSNVSVRTVCGEVHKGGGPRHHGLPIDLVFFVCVDIDHRDSSVYFFAGNLVHGTRVLPIIRRIPPPGQNHGALTFSWLSPPRLPRFSHTTHNREPGSLEPSAEGRSTRRRPEGVRASLPLNVLTYSLAATGLTRTKTSRAFEAAAVQTTQPGNRD